MHCHKDPILYSLEEKAELILQGSIIFVMPLSDETVRSCVYSILHSRPPSIIDLVRERERGLGKRGFVLASWFVFGSNTISCAIFSCLRCMFPKNFASRAKVARVKESLDLDLFIEDHELTLSSSSLRFIQEGLFLSVHTCICVYACVVCMFVCLCVYVYVYVHVCVCYFPFPL